MPVSGSVMAGRFSRPVQQRGLRRRTGRSEIERQLDFWTVHHIL